MTLKQVCINFVIHNRHIASGCQGWQAHWSKADEWGSGWLSLLPGRQTAGAQVGVLDPSVEGMTQEQPLL